MEFQAANCQYITKLFKFSMKKIAFGQIGCGLASFIICFVFKKPRDLF